MLIHLLEARGVSQFTEEEIDDAANGFDPQWFADGTRARRELQEKLNLLLS